jgi:4-hydroxybutyrate CoA-transferase
MPFTELPQFMKDRLFTNEEAMKAVIKSKMCVASGFATSEPHTFYDALWDHIQREDITDLTIKQALFMAPHKLCVGEALGSKGKFRNAAKGTGPFSGMAKKLNAITQKMEGLGKLIGHYEELTQRRIVFNSPFIGAATSIYIPQNNLTRMLYPDFVGRNTSRMGVTDMQSIHFPDAVDSMGYDPDGNPAIDTFVAVMTPPNEDGEMSQGLANGANGEIIEKICKIGGVNLLLYINKKYPFTRGYGDAPNTFKVEMFRQLAADGRLFVIEDDGKLPAMPPDNFKNPGKLEQTIADIIVNHIEMNLDWTAGRAIQVGFGKTGVLAIKGLKDSKWTGRSYTEMMEPFTLDLFDAGKIAGSHFVESNGTRTQLDGKMVCTFTLADQNSDFYQRLHNNDAVIIAPASRVVIPEGFYGGLGINNCLGIDFHGQVVSGGRYKNHHSGVGGGAQIFRGLGNGGVAYLCLKSTHRDFAGKKRSSIFPFIPEGTPISHIGPDLMGGRNGARLYVVTEYGVARVSGTSQANLIKSLIEIAHPDFRPWLKYRAWEEFRVKV